MSEYPTIAQALAMALPAELQSHAADLAALLEDFTASRDPAAITAHLTARPVLGAALAALVGQTLHVAERPLHIAGNVGTLQQITISGGYVERIVGTAITFQLAPAPRVIDSVAAQELLAALPRDTIPPLAPLPELHRMPFARNPLFVGREADLRSMARALKGEGSAAAIGQAAAATGIGGIGKTNLATEFVHRYGQFFAGGVCWLSFADPAGVPAEVAACGAALDLPGFADLKLDEQVQRVQAAWAQPLPRLLVFDNCDDTTPGQAEALIQQWKPTTGGCRVLITSRRATWSKSLGVAALPLDVLSRAESIALLRKHRPDLAEDNPVLDTIAAELGDLPLALHLAGSFLETYQHSSTFGDPTGFLADLRDQRLLDHDALRGIDVTPSSTNHDLHVARTFAITYGCLDANDPTDVLAIRLLARAACLAPGETFPRDLLLATLGVAEDNRTELRQAEKGLQQLVALGLITGEPGGELRLHRLLAAFVSRTLTDNDAQGAVEQILIGVAYQINNTGYPGAMQPVATHLRYTASLAQLRNDERAAELCGNFARYLQQNGDYASARPFYERVLVISEEYFGPNHRNVAESLDNLASLLALMGDYRTAFTLHKRALTIYEAALGPEHPEIATTLNNLALLLVSMADYESARPLYERALAIRERAFGPEHPETATILDNLALLLVSMADYESARPLYERALAIRERALGPEHPETAATLNNLASLHCEVGDYESARPLYERALRITEQAFGPIHPDTAQSLNNLALLLALVGDYETARPLYERALVIYEKALGPEHPETAAILNNLAGLFKEMRNYSAARPLYERALAIREHTLDPGHPDIALSLNNLAGLFQAVGNYPAARPLYERALAIREHTLDPGHPDIALSLSNLAVNCYHQGDLGIAADLMRRALNLREQRFGPTHPYVQESRESLAIIEQQSAGATDSRSVEQRIARISQHAEAQVAQVIATGNEDQRMIMVQRLEEVASSIEDNERGANWQALTAHLRELKTLLEVNAPPKRTDQPRQAEGLIRSLKRFFRK